MTEEELRERVIRLEEQLKASSEALTIARRDIDRRLETMNELRAQINTERSIYLTREEYYAKQDTMNLQINGLQKFQWSITGALLAFQILIGLILHYWKG